MKPEIAFALEHAGWPAILVDGEGAICRANGAAVKLFGPVLEAASPTLAQIWSPENSTTAPQFLAYWARASLPGAGLKLRLPGGASVTRFTVLCAWKAEGKDYLLMQWPPEAPGLPAEGKPAAADPGLAHKQKLDCALQLARTVALDFNNALTSILGHTSHILSRLEPESPWRGSLIEVEKSAAKAAEIASDLGNFSRQEKEARPQSSGNLNQLLERSVQILRQGSGAPVPEWHLQFERKLFAAKFDEAKMQQAFLRVLENALQAGSGRITVQTRNLELAEPTQDRNVRLPPGGYVCVEITDNGCGIEPEVLPRIFEPFFTTKRGGHRGLGLAWVYGIVTNHGGGVAVSSTPGAGTSVRVYLPAEKRIVRDTTFMGSDLNGHQTVLMVDDEDLLLTLGQTILTAYGYRVLTANSGQKALDILSRPDAGVDLVITDLVMPSMSGREFIEHLRHVAPNVRVLCTSGYVWPAAQEESSSYLQKPFTSQDLLLRVKQALSGG